jgi:hypothetical protein
VEVLFGEAVFEDLTDNDDLRSIASVAFAETPRESLLVTYDEGSLYVNERGSGDTLGPPQRVSSGNFTVDEPRVAVGPDGRVALAWTELFGDGTRVAFASVRPSGGEFSAPVRVSAPGELAGDADVVVTSDGAVRVAYLGGGPRDSGGPLRLVTLGGTRETLTAGGTDAFDLEMAADGRGGTTVAWQRGDPGGEGGRNAIFARAVTPSGRVGARRKLTRRGEDGVDLTLAVGADGSALVAWTAGEISVGDQFRAVRRSATGR